LGSLLRCCFACRQGDDSTYVLIGSSVQCPLFRKKGRVLRFKLRVKRSQKRRCERNPKEPSPMKFLSVGIVPVLLRHSPKGKYFVSEINAPLAASAVTDVLPRWSWRICLRFVPFRWTRTCATLIRHYN
jgi:hypothetical protein